MKNICLILSIVLLISAISVIYSVYKEFPAQANLLTDSCIILICSFISGFMLNQSNVEEFKKNTTKQIRKSEKANIDAKESFDKIDRLNAKIETLETALNEALKRQKDK